MNFYLTETRSTIAGHEIDYDRLIIEELAKKGHNVTFALPKNLELKYDYKIPSYILNAQAVNRSAGKSFIEKAYLSLRNNIERFKIYQQLSTLSKKQTFDLAIFPTATYRFLKTLKISTFKNGPAVFIMHGLKPSEEKKLTAIAKSLIANKRIKILVHTINPNQGPNNLENVFLIPPPAFMPENSILKEPNDELTLGFLGQYRKEKNLKSLVEAFHEAKFTRKVRLLVQGAPFSYEDQKDFNDIKLFAESKNSSITFNSQPLIGKDWQNALLNVDALVIPYGASRFNWHWSAMLFNAIGYGKPVLISSQVNPYVLQSFKIGQSIDNLDFNSLKTALESFVNNFDSNLEGYQENLKKALSYYNPSKLADTLIRVAHEINPQ